MLSSPSFSPTGAKHSISPKDTVVACEGERAAQRVAPLTYGREGILLYCLLPSMRSSWYAILPGEIAEHLPKRARFARDKGTFLLTSPWSKMAAPGGVE